jgi:hypothetical protein
MECVCALKKLRVTVYARISLSMVVAADGVQHVPHWLGLP